MTIVSMPITQEMRDRAAKFAEKVAKTKTMQTENYTGLNQPGRYEIGYLGELAVYNWFDRENVRYGYVPQTDGKSDGGDFLVWVRGTPRKLEVKTARRDDSSMVMMPEGQFMNRRFDFYVAARLMEDQPQPAVDIMGWDPLYEVWHWEVREFRVLTRCQEYRLLKEPFELIEKLDRR